MYRYFKTQTFPEPLSRGYEDLCPLCMGSLGARETYAVRPRVMKDWYFVYVLQSLRLRPHRLPEGTYRKQGLTHLGQPLWLCGKISAR